MADKVLILVHAETDGTNDARIRSEPTYIAEHPPNTLRVLDIDFEGNLTAAVSAPITEKAILHFDHPGPPQDCLTRFGDEALPIIAANRKNGFLGIAFGKTCEEIDVGRHAEAIPAQFATCTGSANDQNQQAIVILGGYESIEAHQALRTDKEHFEKATPLLVRNARSIDKFYVQFAS